jgi:hypothetical protein
VRQQAAMLLYVAYFSPQQHRMLGTNILVANSHFAALWLDQAIETAEKRGFTGPTFSHQCHGLPRRDVDADVVERHEHPEPVGHIPRS